MASPNPDPVYRLLELIDGRPSTPYRDLPADLIDAWEAARHGNLIRLDRSVMLQAYGEQALTFPVYRSVINPTCQLTDDGRAALAWRRVAAAQREDDKSEPARKCSAERGEAHAKRITELLRVYTKGVSDDRIKRAAEVLADAQLTANEKLTKIDALMRFPATASAQQLGEMLGVKKQAVLKTEWWDRHRKGKREEGIARRQDAHRQRAKGFEPPNSADDE
jgi:hypothetical protein